MFQTVAIGAAATIATPIAHQSEIGNAASLCVTGYRYRRPNAGCR